MNDLDEDDDSYVGMSDLTDMCPLGQQSAWTPSCDPTTDVTPMAVGTFCEDPDDDDGWHPADLPMTIARCRRCSVGLSSPIDMTTTATVVKTAW